MGLWFSSGGGWLHHVSATKPKWVKKTGALVGWARRTGVSLDVLARVWLIYVERKVLFGGGVVRLPLTGLSGLDRAQRKVGRMLLGFGARSPTPAVLGELG